MGVGLYGKYVGEGVEHAGLLLYDAVAYPALHQIQVSRGHVWNALAEIDITVGGTVTEFNLPQLSKALSDIVVILDGITTDIKEVPNNEL